MRKETVVTKRDRKTAGPKHGEEESYLEPIDAEVPNINRYSCEREDQGSDQKGAGQPIHFFERDS